MARWQDRVTEFHEGLASDPTLDASHRRALQYVAMTLRKDGDFDEAKHPRAPDGKFGDGSAEAQKEIQAASAGYGAGSKEHNAALAKHGLTPTHMRTVGSATKLASGMAATWKVGELDPQTFVGRIGKIKDASGQVKPVLLTGVAGKEFGEAHFHYSEDLTAKPGPAAATVQPTAGYQASTAAAAVATHPATTPSMTPVPAAAAVHAQASEEHRAKAQSLASSARAAGPDGKAKSTKRQISELGKAVKSAEDAHRSAIAAFTAAAGNKDLYHAENQRQAELDDLRREISRLEDSQLGPSRMNEFGEWTRKPK